MFTLVELSIQTLGRLFRGYEKFTVALWAEPPETDTDAANTPQPDYEVSVWAKDEQQANLLAQRWAMRREQAKSRKLEEKSLGIAFSGGTKEVVKSTLIPFRDPIWKRATQKSLSIKPGSFLRSSIEGLKPSEADDAPEASEAIKLRNNSVYIAVGAGLIVAGFLFTLVAYLVSTLGEKNSYIYYTASFILLLNGVLIAVRGIRDRIRYNRQRENQ